MINKNIYNNKYKFVKKRFKNYLYYIYYTRTKDDQHYVSKRSEPKRNYLQ